MSRMVDVVVLGGGPTGLAAAASVARRGHSVALVERHRGPFGLPRAGHVDGEAVRILQGLGAHVPLLDDATPYGDYTWYNGAGEQLMVIDFGDRSSSHWYSDYTMYQPTLEQGLLDSLARVAEHVDMLYGHEATAIRSFDDHVEVDIQSRGATDEASVETVSARYALAADGAGSTTRTHLGITRKDYEFEAETWLIVDAEIVRRWEGENAGAQYCDPRRPAFETPLGRRHHRWEWSMLPGESEAEFLTAEKAWELLAARGITPKDVRIVRQQVYRFESKTAERWRDGRVFLLGDAAHTMSPFMGQGLCAGLRDVSNLAWKLDLVLRGVANDSLLDTYEIERRPHAQAWADISRAVGAISCTLDPDKARERDEAFARGDASPPPAFPILETGLLASRPSPLDGQLFPQALVRAGTVTGLFDDVIGCVFTLVVGGGAPLTVGDDERAVIERLGGTVVDVAHPDAADGVHDVDGTYFTSFMSHGVGAVLVRPDRFVFGAASTQQQLHNLVAELASGVLSPRVAA